MPKRPDPDEKFSLPMEGEDVLRRLLGVTDGDEDDQPDEGDDS